MRRGFTLIELLIAIGIIALLAGMAMPMLQIAMRTAKRTNTVTLLAKVDAAVKRFKADIGVYPYQKHDAALPEFAVIDNRLAYHIAHEMTDAERTALRSDAARAKGRYDSAPHRFTKTTPSVVAGIWSGGDDLSELRAPGAQVLNRMCRERAGLMIHAGCGEIDGVAENAGSPLLAPPGTSKGWGSDYLGGEIEKQRIQGDALIDMYGQPLLYVCPVICGESGPWITPEYNAGYINHHRLIESKFGLQAKGRLTATSLASDIRTHAGRPWEFEFELWSSGPDRRIAPLRDAPENRDDIGAARYHRGLAP